MKLNRYEIGLCIFGAGYIVISPVVYFIVGDFLHAFMAWNMILSVIPFILVKWMDAIIPKKKGLFIALFAGWILFLPNAFYMITDLIYLSLHDFLAINEQAYASWYYLDTLIPWLALFHLVTGVIISLIFGFYAVFLMEKIGNRYLNKKLMFSLTGVLFFLSSAAIYIGRFFRYNSWDFLKVFRIIADFFEGMNFDRIFFILGYTVMLMVFYGLFKVSHLLQETK